MLREDSVIEPLLWKWHMKGWLEFSYPKVDDFIRLKNYWTVWSEKNITRKYFIIHIDTTFILAQYKKSYKQGEESNHHFGRNYDNFKANPERKISI